MGSWYLLNLVKTVRKTIGGWQAQGSKWALTTVRTPLTHRRGESIEEKRGSLLIHSFTFLTRLLKQLILHLDCNLWSACSRSHLPSVHIKMEPCEWKGSRCIFRSRVKVRSTEGEDSLQSPPASRNNPTWAGAASLCKLTVITVAQGRRRWLLRGAAADVQRLLQAHGYQQGLGTFNEWIEGKNNSLVNEIDFSIVGV